ncbi:MAG: hypothetical protein B6D62_04550 [Candidatus Cloacimonas sp. 4484_275]|nr:MAG: hypothetical protein B6D62_04550 [Candidatus Cloacimonas sp. 4484_275]
MAEEKFITAKGEVRNVEVSSVPIVHKNKLSVLVTFRDITERKKAEKKLIESEQKYRELYSILSFLPIKQYVSGFYRQKIPRNRWVKRICSLRREKEKNIPKIPTGILSEKFVRIPTKL